MNNHDEMVFEKDSLHGLEEPKDKTKTQEDTGNQGGYYGPNIKERDQAHRVSKHDNQLTSIPTRIGTGKLSGGSQAHPSERQRCEVLSNVTMDMTK
jgi:hypothetical protein